MAINVDTQDLENYPGTVKRVTVDQESIVPVGEEGDEKFVLSFSTTAYSDATARTRIQDLYVTDFKAGWCKSSGFKGNKFALDATHRSIEVKIDSTVSGVGDGYYRITLEHNSGLQMDAEVVAADMEEKIRAISLDTADTGYALAYANASVEYTGGRFWIVSGSLGEYYSGANKTSVKVRASSVNDCSELLGFDISTDSELVDSYDIKETLLAADYTAGATSMTIAADIGVEVDDCLMITDRTNTHYFQATGVTNGTLLDLSGTTVTTSFSGGTAKVQLLREQDPDADPTLWFGDVDKLTRHGIKTIISQIDYSG